MNQVIQPTQTGGDEPRPYVKTRDWAKNGGIWNHDVGDAALGVPRHDRASNVRATRKHAASNAIAKRKQGKGTSKKEKEIEIEKEIENKKES